MKTFVINLSERTDRMELFKENQFPFEVERVEAIKTDPGWIGCTQSHFTVLQNSIERPFLVLEDDVLMIQPWSVVETALSQLPEDWDALWLGATLWSTLERYSDNLFRLKGGYCHHAIIYNTKAITEYMINNFEAFKTEDRKTIDVFTATDVQFKFNCFIVYPLIATQNKSFSDIEMAEMDYQQIINNYNKFTQ